MDGINVSSNEVNINAAMHLTKDTTINKPLLGANPFGCCQVISKPFNLKHNSYSATPAFSVLVVYRAS